MRAWSLAGWMGMMVVAAHWSPVVGQAQPVATPDGDGMLLHGVWITEYGRYSGTSQAEGQVTAMRNNNELFVTSTVDVCGRPEYLHITLVGWPQNIEYRRTAQGESFGGQGAITGEMWRCTNEVLLPCPMKENYLTHVTGTWFAVPGLPTPSSMSLRLTVNYQQEIWVKPPDPCKNTNKPPIPGTDDVYLALSSPPPPPSPPPPHQDPLDALQKKIWQSFQNLYGIAAKEFYDPSYTVQY